MALVLNKVKSHQWLRYVFTGIRTVDVSVRAYVHCIKRDYILHVESETISSHAHLLLQHFNLLPLFLVGLVAHQFLMLFEHSALFLQLLHFLCFKVVDSLQFVFFLLFELRHFFFQVR